MEHLNLSRKQSVNVINKWKISKVNPWEPGPGNSTPRKINTVKTQHLRRPPVIIHLLSGPRNVRGLGEGAGVASGETQNDEREGK